MKRVIFGIAFIIYTCIGQDILFPDDKQVPHVSVNSTTSTTTNSSLASDECPSNMQFYGNATSKECDCRPKFIYYPTSNSCYLPYFQGPCKEGEYLVLLEDELISKCVKNPCLQNGLVMYNNSCYTLNKVGPPCNADYSLAVNETTFKVECIDLSVESFMLIAVPQRKCPAGSRRNSLGVCKEVA